MSYMQFGQYCSDCGAKWIAAFGVVGTSIIAEAPKWCPQCKSTNIYQEQVSSPVTDPMTDDSKPAMTKYAQARQRWESTCAYFKVHCPGLAFWVEELEPIAESTAQANADLVAEVARLQADSDDLDAARALNRELVEALRKIGCTDCKDGILLMDSLLFDLDREDETQLCPNCAVKRAAIERYEWMQGE
jgi:DNA-directed RNA polymerase subunit RPC12/RpoP